jgi:cytidyltransferase-like protein
MKNFKKFYDEEEVEPFSPFGEQKRKTVAIFPGSFRPPHKGHFHSVMQYSKMADQVVVIISKPGKSVRKTNTGKTISDRQAKKVFEIMIKAHGLKNVKVILSPTPSPIKASYDYAETLKDVDVIFGSSKDADDLKRWKTVSQYMAKNNPSITVLDPKTTAVNRLYSATDIRNKIDDIKAYDDAYPSKVSKADKKKIFNILNESVDFKTFYTESFNIGGLKYEMNVHSAMKQANIEGLLPGDRPGAGFSSVGKGDIEATYQGKEFNIEVKMNKNAQMGGTSVRMDVNNNEYVLVKPDAVDEEVAPLFIEAAKRKADDLKKWIDFVRKQEPLDLHEKLPYTVPFGAVTKEAWSSAQKQGLLKGLNQVEKFTNANTIAKAYNRKGVYYIQIGGLGLFYLGKNPLKLPIPKYDGEVNIEFRLGPSGSKNRKLSNGEVVKVVGAGYRCQGRLKTSKKSKFSLDDPESIKQLFSK